MLLQTKRLKIASALPLADVLVREMSNFRVKMTTLGSEQFEAWRERDHDDLVLAVAMAAWMGELISRQDVTYEKDLVLWPMICR